MDERGSWKVGLITLLAFAGIFGMLAFLLPGVRSVLTGGRWSFYIVLDDAGGLQPEEKMVLSGVVVGAVDNVSLVTDPTSVDAQRVQNFLLQRHKPAHLPPYALVKVSVEPSAAGQLFHYYSYQVGSSSLIGTNHVITVLPLSPPPGEVSDSQRVKSGDVVVGTSASSLSDLAKPAGRMMDAVTGLTEKMQSLAADPRLKQQLLGSLQQAHAAAANLNLTSEQVRLLATNANNSLSGAFPAANRSMTNIEAATGNIRLASGRVPALVDQVQGSLAQVRTNIVQASEEADQSVRNIDAATAQIRTFLSGSGALTDLRGTIANFREGTTHLNAALARVDSLTADPKLQHDLPQIISNLRQFSEELRPTLEQAKTTLATFDSLGQTANTALAKLVGKPSTPGARTPGAGTPGAGGSASSRPVRQALSIHEGVGFLYSPRTDRTYPHSALVDPEVELSTRDTSYYLGLYDIGGQNLLTAEVGHPVPGIGQGRVSYRYGIRRGKASLGGDWILNPKLGLYGSLYNPNNPTLDLESTIDVETGFALWTGVDELNRHPRPFIGFRIKPP